MTLRIFTAEQIASAKRQPSAIMEMLKEEHREVTRRMTPAERAAAFKTHNELMALAFGAGERLRQGRLSRIEERAPVTGKYPASGLCDSGVQG